MVVYRARSLSCDSIRRSNLLRIMWNARYFIDLSAKTSYEFWHIDTAAENLPVLSPYWNSSTINAHFELCPREHTQRICPWCGNSPAASGTSRSMKILDALAAFWSGRATLPACVSALVLRRAGVGDGNHRDDRCFDACHDGAGRAWRKTARPRTFAAMTRGWAKCTGRNTGVMRREKYKRERRDGSGAETGTGRRAVETAFQRVGDRRAGWSAAICSEEVRPDVSLMRCRSGGGGDMLPIASQKLAAGDVAAERAEPVYLRNEVAWKKLPEETSRQE